MMRKTKIQLSTFIDTINDEKPEVNRSLSCTRSKGLHAPADEKLCQNAQQGCVASRNILWYRYSDYIQRIAYKENQRQHLPPHEIPDALQELYFAFHKAVQRYDPENHDNGKTASFKTFLRVVLTREFSKYCTRWRIYDKHLILDFEDEVSNENDNSDLDWERFLTNEIPSNQLAHILCSLKTKERNLLEIWLQLGRDKEVARVLGISPAAAKLRRERLFRRIRKGITAK